MLDLHMLRSRATLATTMVVALASGSVSWAQEAEDGEPERPLAQDARDARVEQWASQLRLETQARLESRLTGEIERIERSCRITEEQRKKLELAGLGDLKRSLDRFDIAGKSLRAARGDKRKRQVLVQEIETVRRQIMADLPGQGSMFAKTLARVLSADQMATYREGVRASRTFRHRARVDGVVEIFDMTAGCSDKQRQRLTQLLLRETRLPAKRDEDVMVIMAQAVRLPEAKLRPIFDDLQWRALTPMLQEMVAQSPDELDRAVFDPDDAARPVAARPDPSAPGKK
jgi:hypothetical protein